MTENNDEGERKRPFIKRVGAFVRSAIRSRSDNVSAAPIDAYTLSDGRKAREVVENIWKAYHASRAEAPYETGDGSQGHVLAAYRKELLSPKLNDLDRLKIFDADCDLRDEWRTHAGKPDTPTGNLERRKRRIRQESNYRFALTDDIEGLEKIGSDWVASEARSKPPRTR